MSDISFSEAATSRTQTIEPGGTVSDFVALMKPRVMSLVIFTALVGMVAAPGFNPPRIGCDRAVVYRGWRRSLWCAQHVV